jgi:Na+-transporting NADH:ubiquinone oxidoreductase subunit NqrF
MMMMIMIKIIMFTITVMVAAKVAMMMKRSVIKHHDLQTQGRSGGKTPCIINLHGSERLA